MLNNAWPSIIWHLYDWYLRPGGGYFGTKKANEPLHVQYSYDDHSVVVVNSYYKRFPRLQGDGQGLQPRPDREVLQDRAGAYRRRQLARGCSPFPQVDGLSASLFRQARLSTTPRASPSARISTGSPRKPDVSDFARSPTAATRRISKYADFTALYKLPPVQLKVTTARPKTKGAEQMRARHAPKPDRPAGFLRAPAPAEGRQWRRDRPHHLGGQLHQPDAGRETGSLGDLPAATYGERQAGRQSGWVECGSGG